MGHGMHQLCVSFQVWVLMDLHNLAISTPKLDWWRSQHTTQYIYIYTCIHIYIYLYIYILYIYIWCGKPPFANHFPLETHGFPFFVFCYDLEGITCFFTQFHMGLFEHWILQNPLVNHPEIPNKKLDHSYFIPISNMSCWFNDFPSYKPALIFMRYFPIWFPLFSQEFTIFTHSFRYFSRRFLIFSPKTSSRFSCIFPIFSPYFPYFPIFFPSFLGISSQQSHDSPRPKVRLQGSFRQQQLPRMQRRQGDHSATTGGDTAHLCRWKKPSQGEQNEKKNIYPLVMTNIAMV